MQNKIDLNKLNIYFDEIKRNIENHDLSIAEFKMYYMIFKEAVYSGFFSPEYLKKFANSLLNVNFCVDNTKEIENLKKYYIELKKFIEFIECGKKQKSERFDELTIKKVFKG